MRVLKAVCFIVLLSIGVDAAFWQGTYRRHLVRTFHDTAESASSLDWNGLDDA